MTSLLGPVTTGSRQRLTAHYGPAVTDWLDRVPEAFGAAARSWGLTVTEYHDAGHASVLTLAESGEGRAVVLKAWFDRDRYRHETAALRHWAPVNGRIVRVLNDDCAVACLELVGGAAGGGPRPANHEWRVAQALARLHSEPAPSAAFVVLDDHLHSAVTPRILRRIRRYGGKVPTWCIDLGLNAEPALTQDQPLLLHADLYQENVPADGDGQPVFLDPLPMLGDPAFDWAFFAVYFDLTDDPAKRMDLAAEASGIGVPALRPWCLRLCLDGLLYYHEVGDARQARMIEVMSIVAAEDGAR